MQRDPLTPIIQFLDSIAAQKAARFIAMPASGHADRFWALALALHATKRKKQPLEITVGW